MSDTALERPLTVGGPGSESLQQGDVAQEAAVQPLGSPTPEVGNLPGAATERAAHVADDAPALGTKALIGVIDPGTLFALGKLHGTASNRNNPQKQREIAGAVLDSYSAQFGVPKSTITSYWEQQKRRAQSGR